MSTNAEPVRGAGPGTVGRDALEHAFKAIEEELGRSKKTRTRPGAKGPDSRPAKSRNERASAYIQRSELPRGALRLTNSLLVGSACVIIAAIGWHLYGSQLSSLIGLRGIVSPVSAAATSGSDSRPLQWQLEQERTLRQDLEQQLTEAQLDLETLASELRQEQARSQALRQKLTSPASVIPGEELDANAGNASAPPASVQRAAAPAVATAASVEIPPTAKTEPPAAQPADPAVIRLMARANVLLVHGDIGAARTVLEQASDAGSPLAIFLLAQSYDPGVLAAWGTVGTQGDAAKARELYTKAAADGIEEARNRLEKLQ
jgi:hypothetical protein